MKFNLISVPFKASSSNGFKEFNGIAKFSSAGIVIEYESKFLGLFGDEIKEVRIALDEILDLKFRRGILRSFSKIQIRLSNLTKASDLPLDSGKLKLKIKREDFELAEKAVQQTLQFMNGADFQTLPQANEQIEQLPPVQTSVNELFDTEKFKTNDLNETNKFE